MYAAMTENHPELARQAIITAFLFKNPRLWDDEDQSLDQLSKDDDGDEDRHRDHDDEGSDGDGVSDDFAQMFDKDGD